MNANDWLQFGLWGMVIGTLLIGFVGATLRKEDRHHVYLAGWITLIAATAYYALTIGFGTIEFNGQTIQFARYVDWLITTPLLLVSLVMVALPAKSQERTSIISGIVGLDVFMILTGVFATLSGNRWPWYVFSCLALVLIGYMLYQVVLSESKKVAGDKVAKLYVSLASLLTALWIAYPVVWYLADSGVGKISFDTENAVYAVLDVTAKVVFGLILLFAVKNLASQVKPKAGQSTIEAASK